VAVFIVGLIRHLIASRYVMQGANFSMNLMSSYDDRELMARRNERREASGVVEIDHSVWRVREAVHEASVNRSRE
jgi:hypothetical protein